MSIYGSFGDIDDDNRAVGAPLVYQGGHVFPRPDEHLRGGSVDLGHICTFISPDGPAHDDDHGNGVWPLLRISVRGEPTFREDYTDTVVLTADQVQYLRDHLNVYLARAEVEDGDWYELEQIRRVKWGEDA